MSDENRKKARLLTRLTAIGSALFSFALGASALSFNSDLAWAQAADSLLDLAGAVVLAWLVQVAQRPGDEDHPFGHRPAEPLGALGIALLAGLLAYQVASQAFLSLASGSQVEASSTLLLLFLAKVCFKLFIWRKASTGRGPALQALVVDARNDVLVGALAVTGFFGLRLGYSSLDSWLSFPIAVWIGWSGVELAKENIALLMGVAPPEERKQELLALAAASPGIIDAHGMLVQHVGADLMVHVHVSVDANLTVQEGHDLGEMARTRILEEEDVAQCTIHVDPADNSSDPEECPSCLSTGRR